MNRFFSVRAICVATLLMTLVAMQPAAVLAQDAAVAIATDAETFEIPDDLTTAEQLFGYVEKVAANEPEGKTEQDFVAHHRKLARTVVLVADKVLGLKPTNQEAMQSYAFKLQALQMLRELGVAKADAMFADTLAAARADKRPEVVSIGMQHYIQAGFGEWATLNEKNRAGLIDSITEYVIQSGAGIKQLGLTLQVVDFLGKKKNDLLKKQFLNSILPGFQASKDEQVQQNLPLLEGITRNINLLGSKMDLKGSMLDGGELDWAAYRGKIVLVDFWATWCGPCRTEVPNVLKQYHAYHDKGFDVLGISLDNTADAALSYIKQSDIPWASMFSKKESERGWEHPMARYYGVDGIPQAILVDRDGTVVSMNARGKELESLLRKMLGEPVAQAPIIEDGLVQQVSAQSDSQ